MGENRLVSDLSRLPTGTAGWSQLVDHALSLGDLSEVNYLELKSTLPFGTRPDRKRAGALLARQILGFANRMPDVAAAHLGGFGVVLVGIRAGEVTGAEEVDGTVLHDAVHPFLGDDGPRWDYQYIAHSDGRVLAIVVDPPTWGSPMYACVKDYGDADPDAGMRDGDVYVRVGGRTRRATSHDLSELGRRRDRAPAANADVGVEYEGRFDRLEARTAVALVQQVIARRAANLLDVIDIEEPTETGAASTLMAAASAWRSRREISEFRDAVAGWRAEAEDRAEYVATEFLRHELGKGHLRIVNRSARYLESVRVEVQFPGDVRVLAASDTDYCHHGGQFNFVSLLPEPPSKWQSVGSSWVGTAKPRVRPAALRPSTRTSDIEVDATASRPLARWFLGDLRPLASEESVEALVVLTEAHRDRVDIRWRATARGVDHVYEGEWTLDSAQEPQQHMNFHPA
jgi:hypothetical protein